jgi:hypothetical protein
MDEPMRIRDTTAMTVGRADAVRSLVCIGAVAAALLLVPSLAAALSFQVDFHNSTYQVTGGDTYASLLAQHQSESIISSNTLDALDGISAPVYAGVNNDYSLLMTTSVTAQVTATYTFQVGTDWGRGGASIVIDDSTGTVLDEFVTTDNIWWNNDWNNADVFTSTVSMVAGASYTLGWIGFEDCCGGAATIRFSTDGGATYAVLDPANGDSYFVTNPEPGTAVLLGAGLAVLALRQRRERANPR